MGAQNGTYAVRARLGLLAPDARAVENATSSRATIGTVVVRWGGAPRRGPAVQQPERPPRPGIPLSQTEHEPAQPVLDLGRR